MESRRSCFAITSIKGICSRFADIGNLDWIIESLMMVVVSLVPNFLMGIITFEHPDDDLGFLPLATRSSQWWDLAAIPIWSSTLLGPLCAWTEICGF
ncbi:hypothetical protein D8674_029289 [Pyrus ussuriensis x Pyrus communis]|uniref:Uncharacterized protein n=1 Tax=Pyrus ussuriensis x Pyrus communis TaxID=2448454 RepID=A0A5N5I3P5_9ROSA|nr:hypothetical protein D8674_029289 [Pyrus ussuriensis x Pyrus communis]